MSESFAAIEEAVAGVRPPRPELAEYLEKVRTRAYTVTDEDVARLKATGCSDDEIFEQTVVVAVSEGMRRLAAGLRVLP